MNKDNPIDIWRRKLEFLQSQEATVYDTEQKFSIRDQIEKAKLKLAELTTCSPGPDSDSLDAILLAYSEVRLAAWTNSWTNPEDPDRLLYYVPPHYAVVNPELRDANLPDRRFRKRRPVAEEPLTDASAERVPGQTEEEILTNLLQTSDRLCVSEGPGAGKSIFTRRVQAFLSSQAGRDALLGGKPALAVRWEEWDGS